MPSLCRSSKLRKGKKARPSSTIFSADSSCPPRKKAFYNGPSSLAWGLQAKLMAFPSFLFNAVFSLDFPSVSPIQTRAERTVFSRRPAPGFVFFPYTLVSGRGDPVRVSESGRGSPVASFFSGYSFSQILGLSRSLPARLRRRLRTVFFFSFFLFFFFFFFFFFFLFFFFLKRGRQLSKIGSSPRSPNFPPNANDGRRRRAGAFSLSKCRECSRSSFPC